jgi:hypothetical protein
MVVRLVSHVKSTAHTKTVEFSRNYVCLRTCTFTPHVTDQLFHTPYVREARVIFFTQILNDELDFTATFIGGTNTE